MKDRIRKIRKELDLTQQRLADTIGVKRNTIAQYEMGRTVPSDAIVFSICREFNINEDWLRTGNGEMFNKQSRNEQMAKLTKQLLSEEDDSFKNRLISVLSNLTEEQWEVLADISEQLITENGYIRKAAMKAAAKDPRLFVPDTPEELERLYPPVGIDDIGRKAE